MQTITDEFLNVDKEEVRDIVRELKNNKSESSLRIFSLNLNLIYINPFPLL